MMPGSDRGPDKGGHHAVANGLASQVHALPAAGARQASAEGRQELHQGEAEASNRGVQPAQGRTFFEEICRHLSRQAVERRRASRYGRARRRGTRQRSLRRLLLTFKLGGAFEGALARQREKYSKFNIL